MKSLKVLGVVLVVWLGITVAAVAVDPTDTKQVGSQPMNGTPVLCSSDFNTRGTALWGGLRFAKCDANGVLATSGSVSVTFDKDGAAFAPAATSELGVGYAVDETASHTCAEDKVCLPRMSADRFPYAILRDPDGAKNDSTHPIFVSGGGASSKDNTAFADGTTPVGIGAYIVEEATPSTVDDGKSGAPRMSAARFPYAILRDPDGSKNDASHPIFVSGGGASAKDGDGFSAGTSGVNPGAYIVDEVASTTVAEDKFGAPRMSAARFPYAILRAPDGSANSVTKPVIVELSDGTYAITVEAPAVGMSAGTKRLDTSAVALASNGSTYDPLQVGAYGELQTGVVNWPTAYDDSNARVNTYKVLSGTYTPPKTQTASFTTITTILPTPTVGSIDVSGYPNITLTVKNTGANAFTAGTIDASPDGSTFETIDSTTFASLGAGSIKSLKIANNSYHYIRVTGTSGSGTTADAWITANTN